MGWPLILWSLTFLDPHLPMHVWFCWPNPYYILYYHFWPQKPLNSPDYGPKTTMTGCLIGTMVNCIMLSCITALPALPRMLGHQKFAFQSTSFYFIYFPEDCITCIKADYDAIMEQPIVLCKNVWDWLVGNIVYLVWYHMYCKITYPP